jgi:hypothetical protein
MRKEERLKDEKLLSLLNKADYGHGTYVGLWDDEVVLDGRWDIKLLPYLVDLLNYIIRNGVS